MRTPLGSASGSTLFLWALPLLLAACSAGDDADPTAGTDPTPTAAAPTSFVSGRTPEESGRYLLQVGGCNDCHTDGFLVAPESVPESEWLKGSVVGFRGPWGTTYPPNLRLTVQRLTEDQWVGRLRGTGLPPMPWFNVNQMAEVDMRALYRYIRTLGEPGAAAPAHLPPDVEPATPWLDFVPRAPAVVATSTGS